MEIENYNQGFTKSNHRVTERTEGERTEMTITQKQICGSFQVLAIRKIARLCELCASVVSNRSCIIKTR